MSQVQFACTGCGATLAVRAELAGKLAACPRCKAKSRIPAPPEEEEVWELKLDEELEPSPPPPPVQVAAPGEKPMRFPCAKCGEQIEISPRMAGMLMVCPECGAKTLAPEPEDVGSYGVAGKGKKGAEAEAPLASWWPDGTRMKLPSLWRANLAEAREFAEEERWKKAIRLLHELQGLGREDRVDIDILRKPLAYCLAGWVLYELGCVKERGGVSKPLREVTKQAKAYKSWGGGFDSGKCAACGRSLRNLIGTLQLRTTAGSAYVCCYRLPESDLKLIGHVHWVAKKLKFARALDPESSQVARAADKLPYWYVGLELTEVWAAKVVDTNAAGGSIFGEILGNVLGDVIGDAIGDLLA